MLDKVILVDDAGQKIREEDRIAAHRGKGLKHQAISVFLFRYNPDDGEIELLIQKRSDLKIVGAGQWGNTVCGNVRPDENFYECAVRRLREELGVVVSDLATGPVINYQIQCNDLYSENEFDQFYFALENVTVKQNPDEVSESDWVSWKDCRKGLLGSAHDLAPWFKLFLQDTNLLNKIEEFLQAQS